MISVGNRELKCILGEQNGSGLNGASEICRGKRKVREDVIGGRM